MTLPHLALVDDAVASLQYRCGAEAPQPRRVSPIHACRAEASGLSDVIYSRRKLAFSHRSHHLAVLFVYGECEWLSVVTNMASWSA